MKKKPVSPTKGKKRVVFNVKAEPGSEVVVSGTFNNWDTKEKKLHDKSGNGDYSVRLMLDAGEYQYKFFINGAWHLDPECPNWVKNNFGTLNNVLTVG